jgi:cytochrome d ubiquinol oxidase subunit I
MDVEILARIQFAATVSFHYIYPPLSIGLGFIMVIFESLYLIKKEDLYRDLAKFWTKIFALIFGIGVVTGIVMEFEFGTNWATYSAYVGDIFGSALAAEGIFAFALESGFLGILIFGWNRVGPVLHWISTLGVFLGSMFSAVWIVVANSWQQTPSGFKIVGEGLNARAEITDFWQMVFNPSSVDRLLHVWSGAFLSGAFLVISVHAYFLYKKKYEIASNKALKIAFSVAFIVSLTQLFTGHKSADGVAVNQPAKLAALEGHYKQNAAADLYILGWVDQKNEKVFGLKVPGGLSFLLHQNFKKPVKGLHAFPTDERPKQINAIFQFYHLMVAIGMSIILLASIGLYWIFRKSSWQPKWWLVLLMFSVFLPQIANQAGWFAAEMGRQPWVVYGLLKTSDALSASVSSQQVLFSLILFSIIYIVLFVLFIYLLNKKIKHGMYMDESIDSRPKQDSMSNWQNI